MTNGHVFVADDTVMKFFTDRSKREREDLLRVFMALAESPYQKGDWRQKTMIFSPRQFDWISAH